jgi:hypothetical protein
MRPAPGLRPRNRPVRSFDQDPPAARSVTRRQRVGADLIHMVAPGHVRANRGLELVEGIDVDDGFLSISGDAVFEILGEQGAAVESAAARRPGAGRPSGRFSLESFSAPRAGVSTFVNPVAPSVCCCVRDRLARDNSWRWSRSSSQSHHLRTDRPSIRIARRSPR